MLDQLVALVVPPRCAACGAPGGRAGDVLCGACRRALPWLQQPCCERCALPLPHGVRGGGREVVRGGLPGEGREVVRGGLPGEGREVVRGGLPGEGREVVRGGLPGEGREVVRGEVVRGAVVGGAVRAADARCPARDAPFDAAWSAVAYEGVARDAMHALKFSAARPLADVMAAQIAANAPPSALLATSRAGAARRAPLAGLFVEPPALELALVAVPAHPARRRGRGFDPAELLARALARRTGLALVQPLRRSAAPSRQLGADRATRRTPGRLGFEARKKAPKTAILVDDVHTTGATLSACAAALRECGAERIVALTWARAL